MHECARETPTIAGEVCWCIRTRSNSYPCQFCGWRLCCCCVLLTPGRRSRSRNCAAAVSGWRAGFLRFRHYHAQPDAGCSRGHSTRAFPTFSHQGVFNSTWGFYRDFDLTVLLPVVANHYEAPGTPTVGGTALGAMMVLVKDRFYRRDSPRGTTQAFVTTGPKLPTRLTSFTAPNASLLPAGLQPSSGSADFLLAANWTYTGLFNLRRTGGRRRFSLAAANTRYTGYATGQRRAISSGSRIGPTRRKTARASGSSDPS